MILENIFESSLKGLFLIFDWSTVKDLGTEMFTITG